MVVVVGELLLVRLLCDVDDERQGHLDWDSREVYIDTLRGIETPQPRVILSFNTLAWAYQGLVGDAQKLMGPQNMVHDIRPYARCPPSLVRTSRGRYLLWSSAPHWRDT